MATKEVGKPAGTPPDSFVNTGGRRGAIINPPRFYPGAGLDNPSKVKKGTLNSGVKKPGFER